MKLANFVTKLQGVLRPKQEEIETNYFRKGKRIAIPAKDVERIYQRHRNGSCGLRIPDRKNLPAETAEHPFYEAIPKFVI